MRKVNNTLPPLMVLSGDMYIKHKYWGNISIMYIEEIVLVYIFGIYIGQSENQLPPPLMVFAGRNVYQANILGKYIEHVH